MFNVSNNLILKQYVTLVFMFPDLKWSSRDSDLKNGPHNNIQNYSFHSSDYTIVKRVNTWLLQISVWAVVNRCYS